MKKKIIANTFTPEVGHNAHFTISLSFLPFSIFYFSIELYSRSSVLFVCRRALWVKHKQVYVLPIQPSIKINYSAWGQPLLITKLMRVTELLWIVMNCYIASVNHSQIELYVAECVFSLFAVCTCSQMTLCLFTVMWIPLQSLSLLSSQPSRKT